MTDIGDIIQVDFYITDLTKVPKERDLINIRYNDGKVKGEVVTVLILEGQAFLSIRVTEVY